MFESARDLQQSWWERLAEEPALLFLLRIWISNSLLQTSGAYLSLWRFEVRPEIYFESSASDLARWTLWLIQAPGIQIGLGVAGIVAAILFIASLNFRSQLAAWAIAITLWLAGLLVDYLRWSKAFQAAVVIPFIAFGFVFWWRATREQRLGPFHGPFPRFASKLSKPAGFAILVLGFGCVAVALDYWGKDSEDYPPENAPFIGQRMINRRGAWLVEEFSNGQTKLPYPAAHVFFHRRGSCASDSPEKSFGDYKPRGERLKIDCLPLGPKEVRYRFENGRLHLEAPNFSLTLRPDNWGPGYYDDLLP